VQDITWLPQSAYIPIAAVNMLALRLLPFDWIHLPVFVQCKYVIVIIPGYRGGILLN